MQNKKRLRDQYFKKRKTKYFEINSNFFKPLVKLIKKNLEKKILIYLVIIQPLLK